MVVIMNTVYIGLTGGMKGLISCIKYQLMANLKEILNAPDDVISNIIVKFAVRKIAEHIANCPNEGCKNACTVWMNYEHLYTFIEEELDSV